MGDSQAGVTTVVIVKDQKREIAIKNKIKIVYSFDTFREILCSCCDGIKNAETTEARVSSSVERREEALIDMDETISLANEIFLVKTIRFDIILKISEPSGANDAASRSVVDVLMVKRPTTILKALIEKNKKTAPHNELIRDMQKSPFLANKASQKEGHKVLKSVSNAMVL